MSERPAKITIADLPPHAPYRPAEVGWREKTGSWTFQDVGHSGKIDFAIWADPGSKRIILELNKPGAAALDIAFRVPADFQAFGGGERFDRIDLAGHSVRYYLENFGLGNGTYLPSPWISTTLGYAVYVPGEAPAIFHIAAPHDPNMLRIQVEGENARIEIHVGDLAEQYGLLIQRIGPPIMPDEHFFGLWKAGDWRFENAITVAADVEGHRAAGLPLAVKLIDAYWASEVHSFAFDEEKYPEAWDMVTHMAADGTDIYLWLCPWVVVGTKSFEFAKSKGFTITDAHGQLITRRPGANPNVVAALIDYSNPEAAAWWSDNLRGLLGKGIKGFKADFGEQFPENGVLYSGETGGIAHNSFVRHYLEATIAAFDGNVPAIISRSGSPTIRAPIWTGDQTSDFCPKTGLPSSIRAVQSAAFSGWSFVGSDLGGYFGTPTAQVFARWAQFACFTPLMMLHGLGCREPWDMDEAANAVYREYAKLHLALKPVFERYGREAAQGGLPMIRMMPLAFPEINWRTINDWDQQFMLGEDILVAPVAFYGNTRAVYLPQGDWFDVLAQQYVSGPVWCIHEVALEKMPIFVRKGAEIPLAVEPGSNEQALLVFDDEAKDAIQAHQGKVAAIAIVNGASPEESGTRPTFAAAVEEWFGRSMSWRRTDRTQ